MAVKYHNKSAAEQSKYCDFAVCELHIDGGLTRLLRSFDLVDSIDMAWALFMDEKFKDLRSTIYGTDEELKRFRSLLVNSVMGKF